jgi:hypothetical protein
VAATRTPDPFLAQAFQDENWDFFFPSALSKLEADPGNLEIFELLITALAQLGATDWALVVYAARPTGMALRGDAAAFAKKIGSLRITYKKAPADLFTAPDHICTIDGDNTPRALPQGLQGSVARLESVFGNAALTPRVSASGKGVTVVYPLLYVGPKGAKVSLEHKLESRGYEDVSIAVTVKPGKEARHSVKLAKK